MATRNVFILGAYQTDFARNLNKESLGTEELMRDTIKHTFNNAGIGPESIECIHVANAFGQLYTGQGHLGAMPASVVPELWGVPSSRHEAACASSSVAVLAAMAEIQAGRYDCVLVVGIEQEKTMPGNQAAKVQEAAAWVGQDTQGVEFIWPHTFNEVAGEYERRYGLDPKYLHGIGEKNLRNAQLNPNAQTRSWKLREENFASNDEFNPVVCGRLRRNDICQITDGAAGLVLVSDRWVNANHKAQSRIVGWGHSTVGLGLQQKLERNKQSEFVMPHVRDAITAAFKRAQISGVDDLDVIEAHDCMTPSEYMAIDHFGITPPGQSWQAVDGGDIARDGRIPVNPGGGLIGGGHPVGATGARMLVDATKQVTGNAGDYQIENAQRVATLNIGGSTATTVSFIVENANS